MSTFIDGQRVRPRVGEAVHYISWGTPVREDGTQAYTAEHRAADITEVAADGVVGLMVKNPTGLFFHPLSDGGCIHDYNFGPASWHYLGECGN